jgi:hypothetical protein
MHQQPVVTSIPVTTYPWRALMPMVAEHLLAAIDMVPLAFAIFQQDQFEKRVDCDVHFYPVPGAARVISDFQRTEYLRRAQTAMTLGDQVKRELMVDMAAMAILRGIVRGATNGSITADNPLAKLDLTTAKAIAKLAVDGALSYAAGNPLGHATERPVQIGTRSGVGIPAKESRTMSAVMEDEAPPAPAPEKPADDQKPVEGTSQPDADDDGTKE